jgi:hypothetical protein
MRTTAEFERVLSDLIAAHERLVELIGRERSALRAADAPGMAALSAEREIIAAEIASLDRRRAEIARAIIGRDAGRLRISQVLAAMGSAEASRLSGLSDRLRAIVSEAHRGQAALRDAAASIAGHLAGVMSRVVETCAPARTYTASGRVALGASTPGVLDVRR